VNIGSVGVGGSNPVRIQSMTTSDTQDIDATVRQSIALAEVGCEIVRITAPNVQAARCLRDIRKQFSAAGFAHVPLVADIHFLPQAAMEAVEHVEKVRVNPGNYADKKRFAVLEYSDAEYNRELERLHEAFSPLVLRARALGRSLRIGTNHGSLSDRIMNRYGDTPLGMVESALEFLRIAESHGFRQMILSMKASNPKVMIQAYRLLVERMQQESMAYPLHLGVTEAGDGEDGRIKSAIGIGSLLLDGLGDTIRVSLTEDSVYEIPVARALAAKTMSLWSQAPVDAPAAAEEIEPFRYTRRASAPVELAPGIIAGGEHPPRALVRATPAQWPALVRLGADTPAEGLIVAVHSVADLEALAAAAGSAAAPPAALVLDLAPDLSAEAVAPFAARARQPLVLLRRFTADDAAFRAFLALARRHHHTLAVSVDLRGRAGAPGPGSPPSRVANSSLHWRTTSRPAGHAVGSLPGPGRRPARGRDHRAPLDTQHGPDRRQTGLQLSLAAARCRPPDRHPALRRPGRRRQHRNRDRSVPVRPADLQRPAGRRHPALQDGVRRLPVLRAHPVRPANHHPAHPGQDRPPQGRENRHHGLHRQRTGRDGRRRLRLRRRRPGQDQPLRRQNLRAVQPPPGRGRRAAHRPHSGAWQVGGTRRCRSHAGFVTYL
jgi:1-hydroxy-2-methyl-2-(E)-butenyl 4-diphosphate synthase